MKFYSKASNYCLVLKHGLPGNKYTGEPPTPGVYVKFEHGLVDVQNEEHIELMLRHPKLNVDFFQPEQEVDPYAHRRNSEVQHDITEFEYGQPKRVTKHAPKIDPKLMQLIQKESSRLAAEKFEALLEALKGQSDDLDEDDEEGVDEETTATEEEEVVSAENDLPDPIEQQSDDISDEEVEEVEEEPKKKAPTTRKKTNKKKTSKSSKK